MGRSKIKKIFKEHTSMGIIEYFFYLKINTAKELVHAKRMNFTQISEHLGYTSIHTLTDAVRLLPDGSLYYGMPFGYKF